jgi:hypothetical protein
MQDKINSKKETVSYQNDREKNLEVANEKEVDKEMDRRLYESQVAYLKRAEKIVTQEIKEKKGILFDVSRAQEEDLPKEIIQEIEIIVNEAAREQTDIIDSAENNKAIEDIKNAIGYHNRGELSDSDSFDATERGRKFFEIQKGGGASKRETYWNTLFFSYNTEATRALAKQLLDDKKIVLLGGGRSRLSEELKINNIIPESIANVDPFVENIEVGADSVISLNAAAENFTEKMNELGIETADEIWAEYSVPAYLEDPKEIHQLMKNIDKLLANGGVARIWPIQVGGSGDDKKMLERKNALVESLEELNKRNKYEIVLYRAAGRDGFLLHKTKLIEEESQNSSDQRRVEEIKNSIKGF